MGSSQTRLLEVTGGDNVARDYVLGSSQTGEHLSGHLSHRGLSQSYSSRF